MKLYPGIVLLLIVGGLQAIARADATETATLCDRFAPKILSQVTAGKILDAMGTAAEYEQAMLALYPPAGCEQGEFRSAAYHLRFRNTLPGTEPTELAELNPSSLLGMGGSFLLRLEHPKTHDVLLLMAFKSAVLLRRLGIAEETLTEKKIQSLAQLTLGYLGDVQSQSVRTIGEKRVLVSQIAKSNLEQPIVAMVVKNESALYFFILVTVDGSPEENTRQLTELIQGMDLNYLPPEATRIAAVRKAHLREDSIADSLSCIRDLAMQGEYGAAADDIASLRQAIAAKLPRPKVTANVALHQAYGIRFRNPDPAKWKLSIVKESGFDAMALDERFAVNPSGLYLLVIDICQAYGPETANEIRKAKAEDEDNKEIIKNAGRNSLQSVGTGKIITERFRMLKGTIAYEGIIDMAGGLRMKEIVFIKNGGIVALMMLAPKQNYAARAATLDAIVEKYLSITELTTKQ